VAIHELDICRWLLDDEYEDVQCVKVRQSANSNKGYDNPQRGGRHLVGRGAPSSPEEMIRFISA